MLASEFVQTSWLQFHINRISEYPDDGTTVLLDANENAFGPSLVLKQDSSSKSTVPEGPRHASKGLDIDALNLHRYPDPYVPNL